MFGIGNLISGVLDKVLPQQLHPLVDVGAAIADLETGNPVGGFLDAEKALGDVEQGNSGGSSVAANPAGSGAVSTATDAYEIMSQIQPLF